MLIQLYSVSSPGNHRGRDAGLCFKAPPTPTDRRQMVISELIETEKRYIANLETLLNFFLPSLELLVAPRDLRLMFPAQLEPLLEAHRRLVRGRRQGYPVWPHVLGCPAVFPGFLGDRVRTTSRDHPLLEVLWL